MTRPTITPAAASRAMCTITCTLATALTGALLLQAWFR